MATKSPQPGKALSLQLEQSQHDDAAVFQLNFLTFTKRHYLTIKNIDPTDSWTLITSCISKSPAEGTKRYDLDVAQALRSGLLEIIDDERGHLVPTTDLEISKTPTEDQFEIETYFADNGRDTRRVTDSAGKLVASLNVDTTAEVWKSILSPGRMYSFRLSGDRGDASCYRSSDLEKTRMPLSRDTSSRITFTVHDTPPAPRFTAHLRTSSPVCHISGSPKFKWVVDIKSHEDRSVTICTASTEFGRREPMGFCGLDKFINCRDAETDEPVEFSYAVACWDSYTAAPATEDEYVEVPPRGVWTYEQTLDEEEDLQALKAGRKYKICLGEEAKAGFGTRWLFGTKEETRGGETPEVKERWSCKPGMKDALTLEEPEDSWVFETVE